MPVCLHPAQKTIKSILQPVDESKPACLSRWLVIDVDPGCLGFRNARDFFDQAPLGVWPEEIQKKVGYHHIEGRRSGFQWRTSSHAIFSSVW